jgi:hypothetical protein
MMKWRLQGAEVASVPVFPLQLSEEACGMLALVSE